MMCGIRLLVSLLPVLVLGLKEVARHEPRQPHRGVVVTADGNVEPHGLMEDGDTAAAIHARRHHRKTVVLNADGNVADSENLVENRAVSAQQQVELDRAVSKKGGKTKSDDDSDDGVHKAKWGDNFSHGLSNMLDAHYPYPDNEDDDERDSFYADVVTTYHLALWNLTNYSMMVKTRSRAQDNPKLLHKIGIDAAKDKELLYSQIAHLLEVIHTSPYNQAEIKDMCPYNDFTNFQKCLSVALCLVQAGVKDGVIDEETLSMLTNVTSGYMKHTHSGLVAYMKNVTNGAEHLQDGGFSDYTCKQAIADNEAAALVEDRNDAVLFEQGVTSSLFGRRRRRRRRRRLFSSVVSGVEKVGSAIKNEAEYGVKAAVTKVEDGIKFVENLAECLGHTTAMQSAGYKFEFCYNGAVISNDCGAGVGVWFEATIKNDITDEILAIWKKFTSGQNVDIDEFSLEASVSIVIGGGIDLGIVSADLGVGAEAALSYEKKAGEKAEFNFEIKAGVMGAAGVELDNNVEGCPFGAALSEFVKCFQIVDVTTSILCCEVELFTGHTDCR